MDIANSSFERTVYAEAFRRSISTLHMTSLRKGPKSHACKKDFSSSLVPSKTRMYAAGMQICVRSQFWVRENDG